MNLGHHDHLEMQIRIYALGGATFVRPTVAEGQVKWVQLVLNLQIVYETCSQ